MLNGRVGIKLVSLILLATLLVVGVGLAGLRELGQLSAQTVQLAQAAQASQYAHALERDLQGVSQALTEGMTREDPSWFEEPLERPLADFQANTPLLIGLLEAQGQRDAAASVSRLHATLIGHMTRLRELATRNQWNTGYLSLANEYAPAQDALLQQLHQLDVELNQQVNQTTITAQEQRRQALRTVLLALVGTMIGLGIAGRLIWQNLVTPIRGLTDAAARLASGDLAVRVPHTQRQDELGQLTQAFNGMADELAQNQERLTAQVAARTADLQAALTTVEARNTEQQQLLRDLEAQRLTIRELSIPTIPVTEDTLVLPLIGALDSQRLREVQEIALHEVVRMRARWLFLDVTGVPVVDTQVAQGLMQVIQGATLLGTRAALIGVRPEVAQAIVGLGLDLSALAVYRDLQSAIRATLRRS